MPITPVASQTIRLFVSSTFADFPRERDLLQRHVFPPIAALCRAAGYRFLPIDLRWGVSESASTSQRTLPIIFEELARCQRESPDFCFLLLLGDRYGSRLLPDTIPTDEYERLAVHLDGAGLALLRIAYRLDENAVPPAYVVQPPSSEAQGEHEAAGKRWHAEVAGPLLKALGAAAVRAELAPTAALRYTGSVTHQEVQRGLLDEGDPSAALCVFRRFTTPPTGPAAKDYVEDDPAARTLRAAVEGCLSSYRAAHAEQDPVDLDDLALRFDAEWDGEGPALAEEALVAQLRATLERRVRAVIARHKAPAPDATPADKANARFAAERLEHFVGREEPLAAIAAYLSEPAVVPLVVAGPGGVGKSTLLAKVVADARAGYPDALLLTRYVSVTPGAASLPALLDGLRADLAAAYGQPVEPVREDYERAQAFRTTLNWAAAERPLILVVDALDQLGPPPVLLDWLPEALPPHTHLIVSLLDEADRPELATLLARQPAPAVVPLGRMNETEGGDLLTEWLGEAHRALTDLQRAAVLTAFAHQGRPLYLRLAFEEARRWRSFDDLASLPPLDPAIPGLLAARFARLEQPDEHGPELTGHTLGLLRAAKNGLTEDELLALLSRDAEVRDEQRMLAPYAPPIDPELPLPAVLWARLSANLAAYLTEREADGARLLTFYHRQLAEVAAARYLQPPDGTARHAALARYFEAQPLLDGAMSNQRKLSEQPTQEATSGRQEELRQTLTDLGFLEQKITVAGTAETLGDLGLAAAGNSPPEQVVAALHLGVTVLGRRPEETENQLLGRLPAATIDTTLGQVAEAIKLGAHILDREPAETESQLRGRLPQVVWARLHSALPTGPRLRLDTPSLSQVGGLLLRTLQGHTSGVKACAFSPDGRTVLSASDDHMLRLWDVAGGHTLHTLTGHTDAVRACAFSPDGRTVLSASSDHTLRLWNVASGQTLHTLAGHTDAITACAFSPDGRLALSACWDGTLRLWDVASGQTFHTWMGHNYPVLACAFSPDSTLALSASWDFTLQLWDVASYGPVQPLEGHTDQVVACAFSPDGMLVLSASLDHTLRLWDVASGQTVHALAGHTHSVHACAFSPDGRLALSACWDGTLRLWDVASGQTVHTLDGHVGRVYACAFSPDGRTVLSASSDHTLRLWDVASGQTLHSLAGHFRDVHACAFSPDGSTILSASDDQTLRLWDVAGGHTALPPEGHTGSVVACTFSPDGRLALSASLDHTLRLWEAGSGQYVQSLDGHSEAVMVCAFSPNGSLVLSASSDRTLRLWDVATWQTVHVLQGHANEVWACTFSPDGRTVLSASYDCTMRLWDVASGQTLQVLQGHTSGVKACAFSPDGRTVLSASDDHTLRLWNVAGGHTLHTLTGHTDAVRACAFSPDGRTVLSASSDHTLRLWNVASGQTVHVLEGHADSVFTCAFSPDGQLALSAAGDFLSKDNTPRLWNVASGQTVHALAGHTGDVHTCAFSQDGRLVLSCSSDRTLRLWDVASGRQVARFDADFPLQCCALSPNGEHVVSGDENGGVHLLNILGVEALPSVTTTPTALRPMPDQDSELEQASKTLLAREDGKRGWWAFWRR